MELFIREVPYRQLERVRPQLIHFLRRYGDKRVTHKAISWLKQLPAEPYPKGTLIAVALDGKYLVGVTAIGNYGLDESLIAVKPAYRTKGIGKDLVRFILRDVDRLYAKVATDNIPSLKLCLSMGMVAFDLFTGVTGKPTLWLGLGNWDRTEVRSHQ